MKITREELSSFTNNFCLSRAKTYLHKGLIELISLTPTQVIAWVIGTKAYKVSLKRTEKTLEVHCTCPAFEEAHTCKHLAATGLAIIKHYQDGYKPSDEYFEKATFFKCR